MTEKRKLSRFETAAALIYLPVHLLLVPLLLRRPYADGLLSAGMVNFICYAAGAVYMLLFLGKYLRRDFDPLCERPFFCLIQVAGSYIATIAFNSIVAVLLYAVVSAYNPNTEVLAETAIEEFGVTAAAAVFLAPIVEELIFRAGIFGAFGPKRKGAAYVVSIVCFSLYHVAGYIGENPLYALYALQYVPVSWLLCRCYEKTDTIWTPIFLHMLINGISMGILGG